jgi:hypothetical protein
MWLNAETPRRSCGPSSLSVIHPAPPFLHVSLPNILHPQMRMTTWLNIDLTPPSFEGNVQMPTVGERFPAEAMVDLDARFDLGRDPRWFAAHFDIRR